MLEAKTHKYLRKFLKKNSSNWKHLYSFGRIISSFVRKKENLLINSEIFLNEEWFPGVLMTLFLHQENSRFVIPAYQLQFLLNEHLPLYKEFGFDFLVQNNQIIFSQHKVSIQTLGSLLDDYRKNNYEKQIIIFFTRLTSSIFKDMNVWLGEDLKKNFTLSKS